MEAVESGPVRQCPPVLIYLETVVSRSLVREAPLSLWANFRQRALDLAIGEINKKTDLNIELESIERAKYRRVTGLVFSIKAQSTPVSFRSNL
jgi:hypothetical protein